MSWVGYGVLIFRDAGLNRLSKTAERENTMATPPKYQLTKTELKTAGQRLHSLKRRIEGIKQHTEKTVEKVVRTAEVGGTAFAVGILNGKTGGVEIMGVPLELGAGLALNVLSYMGAAGKMSDHLGNVGDGALASFATMEGVKIGLQWAQKSGSPQQALPAAGTPAITKGVTLTPEEVAHAAAMAAVPR
jgi:hypothetical protein